VPALGCECADRAHDRTEPGDHARSQVVAVGEATRQDDPVDALQVRRLVPQDDRFGTDHPERIERVDVAVRAREQDDADPDHQTARPLGGADVALEIAPRSSIA
jgi:hypothetical protein